MKLFLRTTSFFFAPIAVLFVVAACSDDAENGPVAPAGSNLAGHWISGGPITYSATGTTVSKTFHFWVNSSSTAIDSMYYGADEVLCADAGFTAQYSRCDAPITNGRFTHRQVGGNVSLTISGTFRSPTAADGAWNAHNRGPAGYEFRGDLNTTWVAHRQPTVPPGSQPVKTGCNTFTFGGYTLTTGCAPGVSDQLIEVFDHRISVVCANGCISTITLLT